MGCIWPGNVAPNVTLNGAIMGIRTTYMSQYVTYMSNQMSYKGRHIFCEKFPLNVTCNALKLTLQGMVNALMMTFKVPYADI